MYANSLFAIIMSGRTLPSVTFQVFNFFYVTSAKFNVCITTSILCFQWKPAVCSVLLFAVENKNLNQPVSISQ